MDATTPPSCATPTCTWAQASPLIVLGASSVRPMLLSRLAAMPARRS
jgi:hypothetical protein